MRDLYGKVIVMGLCKSKLYKIYFTKVYGANVANLIQSSKEDGTFELQHGLLWHLNVKDVMHFKA